MERAMEILEFIKSRRSTRVYKENPVEVEKIDLILEAGRYAPSGGNSQTTHFIVVTNKEMIDAIASMVKAEFSQMTVEPGMYSSLVTSIKHSKRGSYEFHYGAPCLIILANKINYGNNIADVSCAMENMMLMANALDLGSCWLNQLRWLNENEEITNALQSIGLQEDERVYATLGLGYANTEDGLPVRSPRRRTGNPVTMLP